MSLLLTPASPYHPVHQSAAAAADELIEDIFEVLLVSEASKSVNVSLIDSQPEIRWQMRPLLLQFMLQLKTALQLPHSTFSLAISIMDRYAAKRIIYTRHHRLVGCVAVWIAAKTQGSKHKVPAVADLVYLCGDAFTARMICEMEMHILSSLEWDTNAATTYDFAQMIMSRLYPETPMDGLCSDLTHQHFAVAVYLSEAGLFSREGLFYAPSILAASAIELSCAIIAAVERQQGQHFSQAFRIPGANDSCKRFLLESVVAIQASSSLHVGEFYGSNIVRLTARWAQQQEQELEFKQEQQQQQQPQEVAVLNQYLSGQQQQQQPDEPASVYYGTVCGAGVSPIQQHQQFCLTPVDSDSEFPSNVAYGEDSRVAADVQAHLKLYGSGNGILLAQPKIWDSSPAGIQNLPYESAFQRVPYSLHHVMPLTPEELGEFA